MRKLKGNDLKNRIQNKFFIRLGLYVFSDFKTLIIRQIKIDSRYKKKEVSIQDKDLLERYSKNYRGKDHFRKNILPRVKDSDKFKGFAIIDTNNSEIAYLSWIDFNEIY